VPRRSHRSRVSSIHSALELKNAATLGKVLAPFSLSHVTILVPLLPLFSFFFFISWFHNNFGG